MVTAGLIGCGKLGSNCFAGTYLHISSVTGLTCTLVGTELFSRVTGAAKIRNLPKVKGLESGKARFNFQIAQKKVQSPLTQQRSCTLLLQGTF